ncbi:RagB/SusD family nutrient uptake outer membrane protein [Pyxidicoccus fallax]|uniref:RagB/SusD family nutrient uptake outer membrane protein n=1 Tax=Pyxidicoccus fallax TaxID=394095 RepID=A0A848L4H0_9BACT|nr:RagB/SusD family nutrient uptake outer membrane protein [Pyxidicoccus fallax]NMO13357.1 RagB/SusD family nutrient uptake outer membrane protein [Pyxidicoccus fallax]NPC83481.1 RagB/SusD family nutrient uptake outer membrane protein [Pyxidicoccus fallax]
MKMNQTKKAVVALSAAVSLGGCGSLDVGDLDNVSLDDFRNNPTPSAVYTAATGLIIGNRVGLGVQNGYVAELGVIGREAFIFDGAEPRTVEELLGPTLDPGGPAFGGNFWSAPYANIRNANTLLAAVDKVAGVTDGQKEGIRGFAKTMQALDFLVVINTRDTNGAPIAVDLPLGQLAPIESKEVVFNHIASLLDQAATHLSAQGAAFPFKLTTGFEGDPNTTADDFSTPATFLKFNRAIKARVSVYQGNYTEALTALSQSFIDSSASADEAAKAAALVSLNRGVYHTFRAASGDVDNGLLSLTIFAHPSIVTDADKQADGTTVDDRVTRKTRKLDEAATAADGKLSSDLRFTMYTSNDSPIPLIRNEELILLRAEANLGLNNFGAALDDINYIRTVSGRLPAVTGLETRDAILNELLKQKRYSLLFEGGHRWIDMRRYGKLDELPRELDPSYGPHERFPIPAQETDGRK